MAGLTVTNLSKIYGDSKAVDNVSLEIADGEFLALIGPSGCGKTTLLRLLAGFEVPDGGQIHMDGEVISDPANNRFTPPEARQMGMVFQAYALWPHMSVAENIAYPLKIRGLNRAEREAKVVQALAQTGLEGLGDRQPKDLSGGQQQRVALARCLVAEPHVILLDEPLANLDKHLRASMEEAFRRIHQESGVTFVYVTHDQQEAMALADRIAVLHQGSVQQCARPEALYREPANAWVAQFIGEGKVIHIPATSAGQHIESNDPNGLMLSQPAQASTLAHVRPTHVTLGEGSMMGKVISCVYRGERYAVELDLDNGDTLLAYDQQARTRGDVVPFRIDKVWTLSQ
ncbi:ABC transporter ATP-binding protein [Cardiobacteriaceae bacterium TAE3-ERU3]|nr:ABC transporter ATP-binding protein [Cardiobacteriaceae bacterium TAE3-ERU3]